MQCNYCGAKTIQDDQGDYCDECLAYMRDDYQNDINYRELPSIAPGEDSILSPHQFDDEQPRSLERFHLDDDTGPEQPYLGEV
jgi:hypothetical protein